MNKDGLLLKDEYSSFEQIDDVIKQYSSATISLVSIVKLILEKELKSGGYYHFVRQFGGEGSPEVDESFSAILTTYQVSKSDTRWLTHVIILHSHLYQLKNEICNTYDLNIKVRLKSHPTHPTLSVM